MITLTATAITAVTVAVVVRRAAGGQLGGQADGRAGERAGACMDGLDGWGVAGCVMCGGLWEVYIAPISMLPLLSHASWELNGRWCAAWHSLMTLIIFIMHQTHDLSSSYGRAEANERAWDSAVGGATQRSKRKDGKGEAK